MNVPLLPCPQDLNEAIQMVWPYVLDVVMDSYDISMVAQPL